MKKAKMKRVAHFVTVSKRLLDDFKEKNGLLLSGWRSAGKYYSLNQLIELAMNEVFFTPNVNTLKYYSLIDYTLDIRHLVKKERGVSFSDYDEKIKITVRLNPGFNEKCQEFIDVNEWRGFSHMVTLALINARGVE